MAEPFIQLPRSGCRPPDFLILITCARAAEDRRRDQRNVGRAEFVQPFSPENFRIVAAEWIRRARDDENRPARTVIRRGRRISRREGPDNVGRQRVDWNFTPTSTGRASFAAALAGIAVGGQ